MSNDRSLRFYGVFMLAVIIVMAVVLGIFASANATRHERVAVATFTRLLNGEPVSWDDYHLARTVIVNENRLIIVAKEIGVSKETLAPLADTSSVRITYSPATQPAK